MRGLIQVLPFLMLASCASKPKSYIATLPYVAMSEGKGDAELAVTIGNTFPNISTVQAGVLGYYSPVDHLING